MDGQIEKIGTWSEGANKFRRGAQERKTKHGQIWILNQGGSNDQDDETRGF